jgi:dolichol-phosphate mannosyltransferase
MILSVLIPIYNEKKTIEELIRRVRQVDINKEIIIVDDGSKDGTRDLLRQYENDDDITVIYHTVNQGKGAAIRTAISHIKGDIVIIQDADLEYDPNDYPALIAPIASGREKVIYGSRFLNPDNRHSYWSYYVGGQLVTFIANVLYNQRLTDEPTCYKVFEANLLRSIDLECTQFEFCPEVTAKVAKQGIKIREIPIHYCPRSIDEGKKISWLDGLEAVWILIKYRFIN